MPPLAALIPFLGKAVAGAKGLVGLGGAAKAAGGVGSAMKAGAMLPGVLGSTGTRMAGQGLANAAFKGGLGKAVFGNMSKGDLVSRLAPDAFFGGMAALQTPGDIGDKLIAGGASALGGGLGGIALSRGASRMGMEGVGNYIADMAGSVGGDMVGMGIGDGLMRGKDKIGGGAGQTPYERMSAEQQALFAEQIRRQTLSGMGLVPGAQERYFDNTGMI
jgi:hypothetical protein